MIQNFKTFNNMKTKLALKASIIAVCTIVFFGLFIYFMVKTSNSQPKGYYTAQDTLNSYNLGYQKGAENTRQAIKAERTDTTKKSCQDK